MEKLPKIIAVDFDGTLCENKYPEIGEANEDLIWYLRNEQALGSKIILWTCRVGDMLKDAVQWCYDQNLIFDAVNENLPEVIDKFGSDTRKIFANEYIDDRNMDIFECEKKYRDRPDCKKGEPAMVFILEDSDIEALQRGDMIHLETEDGTIYGLISRKFIEDTKEENQ